jgi:hypothetical protein
MAEDKKTLLKKRKDLNQQIFDYDKEHKKKSEEDLKILIKWCKEYESLTKQYQKFDKNAKIWHVKLDYKTWDAKLKEKTAIEKVAKLKSAKDKDSNQSCTNLYYITLAWTVKTNYYVCNSVVDKIKNYLEKMKLTYIFTYTDEFPDRTEFAHEYKIKCTEDVYNTIISSAEYILEISTDSAYESCNIGIFGRKIE